MFVFLIRLISINTSGLAPNEKGGASLNYLQNTALISVMPNDKPYGVIAWKSDIVVTTEETEKDSEVLLVLSRSHGVLGTIMVFYETALPDRVGTGERSARPGVDFEPEQGNVTMSEGVREAYVMIKINHVSLQVQSNVEIV